MYTDGHYTCMDKSHLATYIPLEEEAPYRHMQQIKIARALTFDIFVCSNAKTNQIPSTCNNHLFSSLTCKEY